MPTDRFEQTLAKQLAERAEAGTLKGKEQIITGFMASSGKFGPRYTLSEHGDKPFMRMNANDYLGMSNHASVHQADEHAVAELGMGPGAVRFISGTWQPHTRLERRLAEFHGRESALLFSSAYATVMGVLPSLVNENTCVLSDELNHNCIINAIRLARPTHKAVYPHLDMNRLEAELKNAIGSCQGVIIVTDGIFSMRGDHAPLREIVELARRYDNAYPDNVLVMVDDSHGVGAFGTTGRGTEEVTQSPPVDILVATLGKALGVNGGYVTCSRIMIDYFREVSPLYIYSNPITQGEAAGAFAAVDVLDSEEGRSRLAQLRRLTHQFKTGLTQRGFETIPSEHPIVALVTRDTALTHSLVKRLKSGGVLATGLAYPVVPAGQEEIRFQICSDHTAADIEHVLSVLES